MRRVEVPLRVLDVGKIREAVYDSRMFGVQDAPYAQGFLVIRPSGGYLAQRLEQKAQVVQRRRGVAVVAELRLLDHQGLIEIWTRMRLIAVKEQRLADLGQRAGGRR